MKRIIITSIVALLVLCSATLVSNKTKEKDIIGKWELHLNLSEAIEKETEDEEGIGAAIAEGIVKMVDEIIDEIDITFDFQKNNVLKITHNSDFYGKEKGSIETHHWKIDKKGRVITSSSHNKKISINDNEGWILKKGKLVPVNHDGDIEGKVWMERIKK